MLARQINEITESDLSTLISNKVGESHTLDFKRDTPGHDSAARHEFCADVCAFANTSGGDLLFGMDEDDDGIARSIVPSTSNPDDEQLRLQDLALNGLEPRVTGIHVRAIPVTGGHALIVRVPKSWSGPHRVKTNQHFFLREGVRKRQLDMPEIRSLFARSEGMSDKMRQFRLDRIAKILAGDAPVRLPNVPICVLHLLPIQQAETVTAIDPRIYERERRLPVIGNGGQFRLNLDGGLQYALSGQECTAYTQLFRDGCVETVYAFTNKLDSGRYNIPSAAYERELIVCYDKLEPELVRLGLAPPLVVFFSILRASRAQFGIGRIEQFFSSHGQAEFDRDVLLLPDVTIETSVAGQFALRPVFDLVWQSVGFPGSVNYDEKGNWVGRR